MENNTNSREEIKLSLPLNAAYVSAARLTASSIANRMNFDIDEIEDIKYAVSEACAFLIKSIPGDKGALVKIKFALTEGSITISFSVQTAAGDPCSENDMSILMIKGLIDEFNTDYADGVFTMTLTKTHKEISFDE